MACKCYHAERNFLGKIGVCWGTKECEACACGGDESKCDFYGYVRERASLSQKQTRADQIRAMTDEELAEFMASQVVAMANAIFGIAERVFMEKRGYKISFTDSFTPDLVEIKREYLEMLRHEVEE